MVGPRRRTAEGRAHVLLIMTDDVAIARRSTFGGVIPTPALDRNRFTGACAIPFPFHALCSPTRRH